MSKIIGVTVGTPTSPAKMEQELKPVKTVNGVAPDGNGNVVVEGGSGASGANGKDGVSATHSWNGTTLTVTSASGTSSADLKGAKGDKGDTGAQGEQGIPGEKGATGDKGDKGDKGDTGATGANGTSVTVKSVSESTEDGGSNVVTFSDGKTVTIKNGKQGSPGKPPVKGTDYFTEADKAEMVADVKEALENNEIAIHTMTGGYYATDGGVRTDPQYNGLYTDTIPVSKGEKFNYTGLGSWGAASVLWYNKSNAVVGYEQYGEWKNPATGVVVTVPSGVAYVRFCSFCLAGEEVLEVSKVDIGTASSSLFGKKIVYDGDSICYGAGHKGGYAKLIAEKVGGTYDNQAVGGARLVTKGSNSWHSVVDNLPNLPTDADLYCFNGGVNDYWTPNTLGTYDYTNFDGELDTTTVCGALETIFRYCLNHFVGKPVCFVITHKIQKTAYKENANGDSFKDYHDAMVAICEKYSIPYYDAFSESGLNGWNTRQSQAFLTGSSDGTADGCHPNEEGYKRYYVPQLIQLFERIMPEDVSDVVIEDDDTGSGDDNTETTTDTNMLPTSTDVDGTTVYNGVGYKANTRWSSSSQADTTADGVYMSGHIPVTDGDIIRLKNITMTEGDTSNACKVLFVTTLGSVASSLNGSTITNNASPVWTDGVLTQFTVPSGAGYKYIRLQAAYIGEDSIVTVNQPIE